MNTINSIAKEIQLLLKKHNFLIKIASFDSPDNYIYSNNVNVITIDSTGIALYNEPSEWTVEELDKKLKEFIYACLPSAKDSIIKIERSFTVIPKTEEDEK